MKRNSRPQEHDDLPATWIPGETAIPEPPRPPAPPADPVLSPATLSKIKNSTFNLAVGFSEGMSIHRVLPMIGMSDEVYAVEKRVIFNNFLYLTIALLSDYINDALIQDNETESRSIQISNLLVNFAFFAINASVFVRFLLLNTIDNMSMVTAARADKPQHLESLKCECDQHLSIPGILNDPVTSLFGITRLIFLGQLPYVGEAAAAVYGSFIYGNGLIQSRLSSCVDHRREHIQHHLFSVIGYGAAFLYITHLAHQKIHELTGRDGMLVYDALFSSIYQQFILHAHVATLSFRRESFSFDPFYFDRRSADAYLTDLSGTLKTMIKTGETGSLKTNTQLKFLQSNLIRYWTSFDLRSLKQALENPSVALFVRLAQPELMKAIDKIIDIPNNQGLIVGKRLQKWGKAIGMKHEYLDIARTIWNLHKKGYFDEALWENIRRQINQTAGVTPETARQSNSGTNSESIEMILDDEFHDASTGAPTLPAYKQTLSNSSRHFTPTNSKDASTKVRVGLNQGPIAIVQYYDGQKFPRA